MLWFRKIISHNVNSLDYFRRLGGPLNGLLLWQQPASSDLNLRLFMAVMSCSWTREQRTNPGYNCSTGEGKRRLQASRLSWNMPIYASLCKPLCLLLAKLYFQKNFITLSDNTRTSSSRRESRMLCLYYSWLWARRMCAFHSLTFSSATSPLCRRSSSSLLFILEEYFPMAEWISWIASFSALQSLHEILRSWPQPVQ